MARVGLAVISRMRLRERGMTLGSFGARPQQIPIPVVEEGGVQNVMSLQPLSAAAETLEVHSSIGIAAASPD